MIRGIAFDWGGIFTEGTFDSDAVVKLADLAGVERQLVHDVYFPLMAEFEVGAFDLGGFVDRFVALTGTRTDEEIIASTFMSSGIERTAMFDILASIPAQYTVGMLSNNVPALCDRVRNDLRMERIERFVFSNEIGVRKPDDRAYAALQAAMGLPPRETVFIDDSATNIEAARAFGFKGILLDSMESFASQWRELLPELPLPEPVA